MKYKVKWKFKKLMYKLLGILTILIILMFSWFNNTFIPVIISLGCFYAFRPLFSKQYHAKTLLRCSIVSIIVFGVFSKLTFPISESILVSIVLTFLLTYASYVLKDLLDTKVLAEQYAKRIEALEFPKRKALENLTKEELLNLMPHVRKDIVDIVYGYLHKPKTLNAVGYAMKVNVSEATLYRYLKEVRNNYKDLT